MYTPHFFSKIQMLLGPNLAHLLSTQDQGEVGGKIILAGGKIILSSGLDDYFSWWENYFGEFLNSGM